MMRCLVVDDEALSRAFMEHFVARHDALELVGSCESAIEAANVMKREAVDLIFLNVEMPEMSGMELIESLTKRPQIILVTAKEEYAVGAFNVDVADYLLKPVKYARFLKAVERAEQKARLERVSAASECVFIKTEGRLVKLDLGLVRWIEAQGDYVMIHTDDKRYLVHATMKGMQDRLPVRDFARVHRSYIVRLDRIADIANTSIVIDRSVIPIGASYKEELFSRLKLL